MGMGKALGGENESVIPFGHSLKTSWETWYPYQYQKTSEGTIVLTGLDIELIETYAKLLGQKVDFQPLSWVDTLTALEAGKIDFACCATYSEDRTHYAFYSIPYRTGEDSLFILRNNQKHVFNFSNPTEFIAYVKINKFRLGVKKGVLYSEPFINDFISDPANANHIIFVQDEAAGINKLLEYEIDGFLADRMVGSALVWQLKKGRLIYEHYFNLKTNVYLIFSKKTVTQETVQNYNKVISEFRSKSTYENMISWYLYPIILLQTISTDWFLAIDILGTLFFAISGVLIANAKKATLLSAFIYAVIPSIGGGLLRDIIFGHRPIDSLSTPIYMTTVCITVLVGFMLIKIFNKIEKMGKHKRYSQFYKKIFTHLKLMLAVCDALGLAAFTVTGVIVSLMAKVDPLWLWGPFFSFLTGAAGTIMRDIVSKRKQLADIEGEVYSEVAIFWGLFLSIGLLYNSFDIHPDVTQKLVLITIVGAFVTRMLAYIFKVPNVYFK